MKDFKLLTAHEDIRDKFYQAIRSIQDTYPRVLYTKDFDSNPLLQEVIKQDLVKSYRTRLSQVIKDFTSAWEDSVDTFLSNMKESTNSYKDLLPVFEGLGKDYKAQYTFDVLDNSELTFNITLAGSTTSHYTKSVSEPSSVPEFLDFMRPYLLKLPFHNELGLILSWSSDLELESLSDDNGVTPVIIRNKRTGAFTEIVNSQSRCAIKTSYSFCGENKPLFIETSQKYILSLNTVSSDTELLVNTVVEHLPLPCLTRKVTDILGELPIYGEKTASGQLWTYK